MIKIDFEDVSFIKGDEDTILAELAFAFRIVRTSLSQRHEEEYVKSMLSDVIELAQMTDEEIKEDNKRMEQKFLEEHYVSGKDSDQKSGRKLPYTS